MSMDENGPVTSRGATWGTLEMNCLIEVWSSEKARCEAEAVPNTSANRNDKLFIRVAKSLVEMGFPAREWEKVRDKFNRMKQQYRKLKDDMARSGVGTPKLPTWFNAMDMVLGCRPATRPPVLFDSGAADSSGAGEFGFGNECGTANNSTTRPRASSSSTAESESTMG